MTKYQCSCGVSSSGIFWLKLWYQNGVNIPFKIFLSLSKACLLKLLGICHVCFVSHFWKFKSVEIASIDLDWLFGSNKIKLVQIGSNWFKLDQIGSNLIKLDQTWSNWNKLEWIGSNLIKLDQIDRTWSNWFRLDQIGSDWIKLDQFGLTWLKLDQIGSNLNQLD